MKRAYFAAPVSEFLQLSAAHVLGILVSNSQFETTPEQRDAWKGQISILRRHLNIDKHGGGHLFFEYAIPRMGKRVDVVMIFNGLIFPIEFKVGEKKYPKYATEQAEDYGLDLKNFHAGSHFRPVIPILTATLAESRENQLHGSKDRLYATLLTNADNLVSEIDSVSEALDEEPLNAECWAEEVYKPTPTIVEAAQALYRGHDVKDISRSDAGAENLSKTAKTIDGVITNAKANGLKVICFITGVPGSGKTLAGLNIANERHNIDEGEHAVFLSGNGPLVAVLQEALARDRVAQGKLRGESVKKGKAKAETSVFVQNIHHFRDESLRSDKPPVERVAVFDEAQRAWNEAKASQFMKARKGVSDFDKSEPEFLIEVMNRHKGYAVIVCLIGGGQEINTGEAGLPEWFNALSKRFTDWHVQMPDQLAAFEYSRDQDLAGKISQNRLHLSKNLHLGVSVRSFRAETVSDLVKDILDRNADKASESISALNDNYPFVLTRDIDKARQWLRWHARGTERYGIVASSGALRLKPEGLNLKAKIDPVYWFLNDKSDVRSSYYLEDVATEFDVQGLELDWLCVAWDTNFFPDGVGWKHRRFSGSKWQSINDENARLYLKNAYRVLLTRARQGVVIFVPEGSANDPTRKPAEYDAIFNYLVSIGIQELN